MTASEEQESSIFPKQKYDQKLPILEALREEVHFILSDALETDLIKIHNIESRIKEFESLSRKINDKSISNEEDIEDLVGARVVCLFKSDLSKVEEVLSNNFEIIYKEDKISSSSDSFGYMSIHYVCKMKSTYKGPRYNKIKNVKFEIQIRTICMHAWAAISHYLDYKSEWDIPDQLRKGLNALSGLFYVADEQYESLYNARQESREAANLNSGTVQSKGSPINFDTVSAFLSRKFPDRTRSNSDGISELVKELVDSNYSNISEVEIDINRASKLFEKDEEETKKSQKVKRKLYYNEVGAARVSLRLVNEKFEEASTKK